ncbi:MAG: hypothetical protein M0R05_05435 [Bacilli bacterium]|nr:hypothetical protein [Bacilli bacterium]MDD4077001.1 hypothetical protein [Bacilli bacterium]MDD4387946.1 hypothetical protein [Bacilli bacterium]
MDEKRKILQMLSAGTITVDEAYRLLETVEGEDKNQILSRQVKEKVIIAKKKIEDAMKKIDQTLDDVGDEVSSIVKKSLKRAEEQLGKIIKENKEDE